MLKRRKDDDARAVADLTARLDRLPATRSVWALIALLSLAYFFEVYELLLSGYIAPGLVSSGVLTATTQALFGMTGLASFIAALFAGLVIGTLSSGFLIDRFGRRAAFTTALLGYTACGLVMGFQTGPFGLNLCRFLAGIALGWEMVTINTYITELMPRQMRGRAFAFCQMIGFSAVPVVAFLAWALVPNRPFGVDGWRWVVFIGAGGALFVWYARLRLPESPRWLVRKGRVTEAVAIVDDLERRVMAEHGRPLPNPVSVHEDHAEGRFSEMFGPAYRGRTAMLVAFNIFQTIGYYGFTNWVPTLLVSHGIAVTEGLLYTVLIALAAPVGPLVGFLLGERVERKFIIVGGAATIAVAGLLFGATTNALALVALGLVMTLAGNMISFAYHAYQTELFPTRFRAKAVGFVYSFSRISAMLNAFLIAFFLREFGVGGVFAFIAAAYVIVVAVIGIFGPRTAGRSLEEIAK